MRQNVYDDLAFFEGCGAGDLAAYCAGQGAQSVLAFDLSEKMLEMARETNPAPNVEYRRAAMEDLSLPSGSADVVVSSFALHYVKDYAALVADVARWLRPGGAFVFSVEHPMITANKAAEQD